MHTNPAEVIRPHPLRRILREVVPVPVPQVDPRLRLALILTRIQAVILMMMITQPSLTCRPLKANRMAACLAHVH